MSIPLTDIIQYVLDQAEKQRKEDAERLKREADNSGYMVQYLPCGHAREIKPDETELIQRAKDNTKVDAIVEPSRNCPECERIGRDRRAYYIWQ
jgi:nucleotide-binding universal stress UspA family protein